MDFVKLASICNLKQWSTIAKTDLSDSGYPVWGANGIIGYSNKYNHTERTIMICCRGATCGSINISDGKCYINGNAMCLDNLSKEFNLDFIAYYLKNYDFKKTITGVAQPQITKVSLDIVEVPKLPIERQQEIAQNLKKLELCLTKTRIKLKKYDDLVKSQFIEMFGDVISNPMNWNTKSIVDITDIKGFNGEIEKINNKVWLLNLDMVESRSGQIISKVYVDKNQVGNSTTTFNESYVLYSKLRPYLNKVVLPNTSGYCTTELIPLLPNKEILNKYFLCESLRSESFVRFIQEKVAGAKMPRVQPKIFKEFKLILPPIELQNQFADFVKHIDKLKFTIKQSVEKLELCYKSLMKQYFE